MAKLSAMVHWILLFAILWSPTGVAGQRMAKQVPVTDLDGLYQALLSKSTHIVVNGNIEAGEASFPSSPSPPPPLPLLPFRCIALTAPAASC